MHKEFLRLSREWLPLNLLVVGSCHVWKAGRRPSAALTSTTTTALNSSSLTVCLGEDCVEKRFPVIHCKSGQHDNPYPSQFRAAFTEVSLAHNSSTVFTCRFLVQYSTYNTTRLHTLVTVVLLSVIKSIWFKCNHLVSSLSLSNFQSKFVQIHHLPRTDKPMPPSHGKERVTGKLSFSYHVADVNVPLQARNITKQINCYDHKNFVFDFLCM